MKKWVKNRRAAFGKPVIIGSTVCGSCWLVMVYRTDSGPDLYAVYATNLVI